jgi:hypothetical protein
MSNLGASGSDPGTFFPTNDGRQVVEVTSYACSESPATSRTRPYPRERQIPSTEA